MQAMQRSTRFTHSSMGEREVTSRRHGMAPEWPPAEPCADAVFPVAKDVPGTAMRTTTIQYITADRTVQDAQDLQDCRPRTVRARGVGYWIYTLEWNQTTCRTIVCLFENALEPGDAPRQRA
jgi:hypothetical protein